MARFRSLCGSLDRWSPRDVSAMADVITRTEDEVELRSGGRWTTTCEVLRSLRGDLENAS